jgi:hypothetical protein
MVVLNLQGATRGGWAAARETIVAEAEAEAEAEAATATATSDANPARG